MFKVQRIHPNAKIPTRAEPLSVGYDVCCVEDFEIITGLQVIVPTGLKMEFPPNCYLRIAPRSGLAVKGIDVLAGVVDPSYRGEIKVILINHSQVNMKFKAGDRIAQFIFELVALPNLIESNELGESERGSGGFGSTGIR